MSYATLILSTLIGWNILSSQSDCFKLTQKIFSKDRAIVQPLDNFGGGPGGRGRGVIVYKVSHRWKVNVHVVAKAIGKKINNWVEPM